MKYSTITIGGKERPIHFSYAALYEYERQTGRNAIADFANIQSNGVSVTIVTDLLYCGLIVGHKIAGGRIDAIDFNHYDVAEWAFTDPEAIPVVVKIFTDSFPKTGAKSDQDIDDDGKKTKPLPGMK